jgi:hypothetical protein
MGTGPGPPRAVPEGRDPLPAEPAKPSIELVPGNPKETARLADVSGHLLVVLNHPEPGLGPTSVSVVGRGDSLHPRSPFRETAPDPLSVPDEP